MIYLASMLYPNFAQTLAAISGSVFPAASKITLVSSSVREKGTLRYPPSKVDALL